LPFRLITETHGPVAARTAAFGIDIDPMAVMAARQRLRDIDREAAVENIVVGDALDDGTLPLASFDAIVGNPPYVNIRQLAKALPRERIDELRKRYRMARGNFDLYVLFIERALGLLRPGGRCGLIIPNKWATLDYARPCRELLLEQATIEKVVDLTEVRAFATASVYPQIIVLRKERARAVISFRFVRECKERRSVQFSSGHCRQPRSVSRRRWMSRVARADSAAGRIGDAVVRHGGILGPADCRPTN
jgi:SAM-dependent methyltransferase